MNPVKILIAGEHELTRRSVIFRVSGEATHGIEAIEKARQLYPDVGLMDLAFRGWTALRPLESFGVRPLHLIITPNDPKVVREHARSVDASCAVIKSDLTDICFRYRGE
ncbi:MAG: hypothetical protein ACRD40_11535 [Candidatus Acidiferrales bacterium]